MRDEITIAIDLDAIIAKAFDERGICTVRPFVLEEPIMDEEVRINLELWAIDEGSQS